MLGFVFNAKSVNEKDKDGVTALMHAISNEHDEMALGLIKARASCDQRDNYGKNAFLRACMVGSASLCAQLASLSDLGAVDGQGNGALHYASKKGGSELIKMLLSLGLKAESLNEQRSDAIALGGSVCE